MAGRSAQFQVQFTVDGDGKVQAELQSIAKEAKASAKAAQDAGDEWYDFGHKIGTAMKWAGAAVVGGIALIVRNTVVAEQELAQLGAVLRSTGQDAIYSRAQLVGMADEIAKASNYSSGEILNAETRLLSYSGIASGNFKDALQVAIDQSARLGISVEQSSEIIGRALERPTKAAAALAQQGFGASFTPAVMKQLKALEATGREAEAQVIILDILKGSYGGAAQAARDTLGGALIALKNTAADLLTGDTGGEGLRGVKTAVDDLTETLGSEEARASFANITEGALGLINVLAQLVQMAGEAGSAVQENLLNQLGGHDNLMGGEHIAAQRRELQQVQQELARRARGAAEMKSQGYTTERFKTIGMQAMSAPWRLFGAQGIGGSTESELRNRADALQSQIGFNETIFGDPNKPRVLMSDQDKMPDGYLKPQPNKVGSVAPLAESSKKAQTALAGLKDAQRDLQRELDSTGNPILDAYARRLDDIAKRGEAAARNGVATDQIKEFQQAMGELAAQIRDGELSKFQQEFNDETADMAAQMAGPGVQALQAYTVALAETQKQLDLGVITAEQFADRQTVLADRMNEGAIRVLQDISNEHQALMLNSQQLEIYNNLKAAGVDANSAYGESIVRSTEQLQQQREAAAVFNDIRSSVNELGVSVIADFGSAGDAAERFGERIKRMAAQMFMDRALNWLANSVLGGMGAGASTYTGDGLGAGSTTGFGNNVGGMTGKSLFGFGGGRAIGGGVNSDSIYEINEGGRPEVLRQGNRNYLLPGSEGVVMPVGAAALGSGTGGGGYGGVVINNFGSAQVQQREETTKMPDGSEFKRLIVDVIADDLASGGPAARAGKQRYGWQESTG